MSSASSEFVEVVEETSSSSESLPPDAMDIPIFVALFTAAINSQQAVETTARSCLSADLMALTTQIQQQQASGLQQLVQNLQARS